jgi:DUF4097 and DUF4098 domain-containing protein YvlB
MPSVRATVLLLALPAALSAQNLVGRSDSVYTWRGALPTGAQLTIRNFNGPIDVRAAQGTTAELRAEKRTSRGGWSIQDIAFDLQTSSNGDVNICATLRDADYCGDRRGYSNDSNDMGNRRGNTTVAMTVLLPRGARLKVSTGNGEVTVKQVGGDVQAATGNGAVHIDGTEGTVKPSTGNGDVDVRNARAAVKVSTGNGRVNVSTSDGPVEVHTGNGSIDVQMTQLKSRDDMSFSTGSGSVRVKLPAGYNGELDASTGSGQIDSDFELKIQGRMDPRRVRATIGTGGPRLKLSSGSGRLEILKG